MIIHTYLQRAKGESDLRCVYVCPMPRVEGSLIDLSRSSTHTPHTHTASHPSSPMGRPPPPSRKRRENGCYGDLKLLTTRKHFFFFFFGVREKGRLGGDDLASCGRVGALVGGNEFENLRSARCTAWAAVRSVRYNAVQWLLVQRFNGGKLAHSVA
jgi:hypothetical protein